MDIREISDDFLKIGNIAVLQRTTGNSTYDFNFRNHFECKSVVSEIKEPVLLHIGAIDDYPAVESLLNQMGMKLLVSEAEHLLSSTIERWYPILKERTPYTKVYNELPEVTELTRDFSFPVFIKGNRQTNRHKKSQCIIENADDYEIIKKEWQKDNVLSWQKAAVREYVPLQIIDDVSWPDMVPISYEFRLFYFGGKCMAYGSYWNIGQKYTLKQDELKEVLALADWAAYKLDVSFLAIDVAKSLEGQWIIIEVNDAQESGFVGVNPLELWKNTLEETQKLSLY